MNAPYRFFNRGEGPIEPSTPCPPTRRNMTECGSFRIDLRRRIFGLTQASHEIAADAGCGAPHGIPAAGLGLERRLRENTWSPTVVLNADEQAGTQACARRADCAARTTGSAGRPPTARPPPGGAAARVVSEEE